MATRNDLSGFVWVSGGDLDEVQRLHCDCYGNMDGGPILDGQEEIEDAVAAGETEGVTSTGYSWTHGALPR